MDHLVKKWTADCLAQRRHGRLQIFPRITFVGLFTIIIGVGPRTVPDVIFHILIIVLLILGLLLASQTSGAAGSPAAGRSIHHGGNV